MTKLKTITPELANDLLQMSTGNRSYSQVKLIMYTNDMKNGLWKVNGETISISKSGRLLNGHHRLKSCILAGVSFDTFIVTDLDDDVIDTIDTGLTRSSGNVLQFEGIKNSNNVASIVNFYLALRSGNYNTKKHNSPAHIISNEYNTNPEYYQGLFLKHQRGKLSCLRSTPLSIFAAFEKYLSVFGDSEKFFDLVYDSKKLNDKHPCYVLSRLYLAANISGKGITKAMHYVYIIKAWNAYALGQSKGNLKYVFGEDVKPVKQKVKIEL